MGDAAAKIETDEVGQGVEGEARGKRESETAPHHVILLLLFSLPLTPSSLSLMLQRIPASVCAFVFTSRRSLTIAQAPEGAGRVEAHRCDSHEGDSRICNKNIFAS